MVEGGVVESRGPESPLRVVRRRESLLRNPKNVRIHHTVSIFVVKKTNGVRPMRKPGEDDAGFSSADFNRFDVEGLGDLVGKAGGRVVKRNPDKANVAAKTANVYNYVSRKRLGVEDRR